MVTGALGTTPKRTGKGSRRYANKRTNGDYLIIKISQNTEKSPGNFRKLAVIQTPLKIHPIMLV